MEISAERLLGNRSNGYTKDALVKYWRIFDYPCGQRLEPLLKTEVERLRKFGEIICSDEATAKLKKISFSTIGRKLVHQIVRMAKFNATKTLTNHKINRKNPLL